MPDELPDDEPPVGTTTEPGGDRLAESLARIGVLLGAERIELYRHRPDGTTRLAGWWQSLGMRGGPSDRLAEPIDSAWFPWGLGHVRPERFVLVRTAAALRVTPANEEILGDDGICTCVHLPLRASVDEEPLGAVCGYWTVPPPDEPTGIDAATQLGTDALLDCPG